MRIELVIVVVGVAVFAAGLFGYSYGWDKGSGQAFSAAADGREQIRANDPTCAAPDGGRYPEMVCHRRGLEVFCTRCE